MSSLREHITKIKDIRTQTNDLWMEILQIAVDADPVRTMKLLARIRHNDGQIGEQMDDMIKQNADSATTD